jgi:hypothetical protein
MTQTCETPPGMAGLAKSVPGGNIREIAPNSAPNQAVSRNPRAVREAKRLLRLEFLRECAGGIAVHAGLVQTFAEIGDTAGTLYSLKRLFATPRPRTPSMSTFARRHGHDRRSSPPTSSACSAAATTAATPPL